MNARCGTRGSPMFARPGPRERILAAASQLFAEIGIRGTSVDALVHSAGVAKASFYHHFASKDELVVAWLEAEQTRWFDQIRMRIQTKRPRPAAVTRELFAAVSEWLEAGDYRGCPYLNAAVELPLATHPAIAVARAELRRIERYLQDIAAAAGCDAPKRLGSELQTLLAGSIALGVAHGSSSYVVAARDAAERLVADSRSRRVARSVRASR